MTITEYSQYSAQEREFLDRLGRLYVVLGLNLNCESFEYLMEASVLLFKQTLGKQGFELEPVYKQVADKYKKKPEEIQEGISRLIHDAYENADEELKPLIYILSSRKLSDDGFLSNTIIFMVMKALIDTREKEMYCGERTYKDASKFAN